MVEGWQKEFLGNLVSIASGQVDPKEDSVADKISVGPDNLVSGGGFHRSSFKTARELGQISGKYEFDAKSILYSKIRPNLNKVALPDFPGICSADMYPMWINDETQAERLFVYYVLISDEFVADATARSFRTGMPKINRSEFEGIEINLPSILEQRKIAEILKTWDEAIEMLGVLRAVKIRRSAAVRQKLFEMEYESEDRLTRAREVFETVSEKAKGELPLLAVMQDIGVVRRDELDRRVVMPEGGISAYKIIRPGDFVISLRSFEGGIEYSLVTGLVSPAYTVLRPKTEIVSDYYRHFFKSRSFIGRLDRLIFGIRDGKQIAFRDFGDMKIPNPLAKEQEFHASTMNLLEEDLSLEKKRLESLDNQKRGLMQKLLTGEWRVAQ